MKEKSGLQWLTDRVCCLPYETEGDRPNLYYVRGDDYSISVDAGNSARQLRKFYDALAADSLPLPRYTVISHWHWDHTFGLCACLSKSISSPFTKEKLREVQKWKWTHEDMKKREEQGLDIPLCTENILREYADLNDIQVVLPDETIENEVTLDLGGIKVRVIPAASTHTLGALYVYLESEKILIVEDADCEDFYHGSVYDQLRLKKMIQFFESLDYEWHCLGHAVPERKEDALARLRGELHE